MHPSAVPCTRSELPVTLPCASAGSITCCTPSWSVAACGGLHMSVLHPTPRTHAADVRRRRVSHRAPALRPHRTDQISMRDQRAHNREGKIFDLFGPHEIWVGVGPRRALQFCSSSWFGRPRRRWLRRRRPRRRRRRSVPPYTGWIAVSVALRATQCACVGEWRQRRFHSHMSAV